MDSCRIGSAIEKKRKTAGAHRARPVYSSGGGGGGKMRRKDLMDFDVAGEGGMERTNEREGRCCGQTGRKAESFVGGKGPGNTKHL